MQEAPCCDFDLCALSNILLYFGCWMFFCSAAETLRSVKNGVSCCVFQTMEASGRKDICTSAPLTVYGRNGSALVIQRYGGAKKALAFVQ